MLGYPMKLPESTPIIRSAGRMSSSAMVSVRGSIRSRLLVSSYGTSRQRTRAAIAAAMSAVR
jgi:hypothetical protein